METAEEKQIRFERWEEPPHGWKLEAWNQHQLRALDFKEIDALRAEIGSLRYQVEELRRAASHYRKWGR